MNPLQTSIAARTTKLPALLLREIGRITIAFAAIEHELNLVAYTLLNVSRAEGRLAVTRQNIRSRMALIKQLAEVKNANLPSDWDAMSKELQHLEEIRDWVAHGVWSLDKPFPRLQISSGSWQPPGYHKSVSSKVIPAAAQVNHETLRGAAITGLELLQLLERFHFQLQAQQRASPEKQPEELHRRPSRQQHRKKIEAEKAQRLQQKS